MWQVDASMSAGALRKVTLWMQFYIGLEKHLSLPRKFVTEYLNVLNFDPIKDKFMSLHAM